MRLVAAALALVLAAAAQAPVNCRGKLTEQQLMTLIAGKVAEPRLLEFVNLCGIGFAWNEIVRSRLRGAGATAAVLSAVSLKAEKPAPITPVTRVIEKPPEKPAAQQARIRTNPKDGLPYCGGSFTEAKLTALITGKVPEPRLLQYVNQCGIGFAWNERVRARLSRAGASPSVLAAVSSKAEMLAPVTPVTRVIEKPPRPSTAAALPPTAPSPTPVVQTPPEKPAPQQERIRTNPKDGLPYVWIPPGTFSMGCSPGDTECYDDEKPAHEVTIPKGFWMGQTPVTQAAYERVTGQNPSSFRGANLPVENISWDNARTYCEAVGMRLPTEAEWEHAARGGTTESRYGDIDQIAWYSGNSGRTTHPVGEKQANAWNLYDMLGNVWQWTADWYGTYQAVPQSEPSGPPSGSGRVLRGGSWYDLPQNVRASLRYSYELEYRNNRIGVRCVGDLSAAEAAPPTVHMAEEPLDKPVAPHERERTNPQDGLKYVWIPPGTFTMGCSPGDTECYDDEKPAHEVTITKGFWMGQTPVTQAAYEHVTGQNPSSFRGTNLPVETIRWTDARTYCEAVGMRLPTEAEWEYAARAGTTESRYGDIDQIAWYIDNSGSTTHEVGQKKPNAWNLYDMLGNVWQWTADWYGSHQAAAQSDPSGLPSGSGRVMRGGSWGVSPRYVRASYRGRIEPMGRYLYMGVRCVGNLSAEAALPTARMAEKPLDKPVAPHERERTNPKDGLPYVWIPPGTFTMGCSSGDNECYDGEKPVHEVTITNGFWIGQTPVTQAAYVRVTGQNPSSFRGASLPVENISWYEARTYCAMVGMRLPTEAEWEYAARTGSTASRYGDIDQIAWYSGNSGFTTHWVGQKQPNAWNLYDMLGNVRQWTADWNDPYPADAQIDPSGPASGQYRVLRGGYWFSDPRVVRASYRGWVVPEGRSSGVGVRCVGNLSAEGSPADGAHGRKPEKPPALQERVRTNPKDGLPYVWIPPGMFTMGCSLGDSECFDDEKPAHEVEITPGLWLMQTPVTVGAWKRYRSATGNPALPTKDKFGRKRNEGRGEPMVFVIWEEARNFCEWSGGRLPTEAEWEYAARAGRTEARYGNLDAIAWYADNSGKKPIDSAEILRTDQANYAKRLFDNRNGPHLVGQKQPNAWNLYDMLGNVWQWTTDWYGPFQAGAQSDPHGPASGTLRVMRGGSWSEVPRDVRASNRGGHGPVGRSSSIGFRCVGN